MKYILCGFYLQPNHYSLYLHDAVLLYARLAQLVLNDGGDITNGTALFEMARSITITGISNITSSLYSKFDLCMNFL